MNRSSSAWCFDAVYCVDSTGTVGDACPYEERNRCHRNSRTFTLDIFPKIRYNRPINNPERTNHAMTDVTAMIFNIQRCSVDDGPGIRTTVFFKGCPLSCIWCHNPESHRREPELMYNAQKCIGCAACASVCDHGGHTFDEARTHTLDRTDCISCGACAGICPTKAVEMAGREMGDIYHECLMYFNLSKHHFIPR